jgi:hypothetical protein
MGTKLTIGLRNFNLQRRQVRKKEKNFEGAFASLHITSFAHGSGVPRNFFQGGVSTNSVDRGQREQGSGGGSP